MCQNADLAVRSAAEKGKEQEITRREFQQALESISSRETTSNAIISNLRNETVALDRRVQELEMDLQQVVSSATQEKRSCTLILVLGHPHHHLERDLGESQASVAELRTELGKVQGKLRRTEDNLFRLENERTVLERRTADEMKKMQEMLASKDEEITQLQVVETRDSRRSARKSSSGGGRGQGTSPLSESRDIKKVESALQKAEKRLAAEMNKFKALEEGNAGLNTDVKLVRDALEQSSTHAKSLDTALEDKTSLVHSLQAQERCANRFSLSDVLSYHCRALRAQVNAQQEEIRSLRVVESNGLLALKPFFKQRLTRCLVSTPGHGGADAGTGVETMEKFLAAVDRLRSERATNCVDNSNSYRSNPNSPPRHLRARSTLGL
jgi:chromosome segregation ATPase